jgi:hypothetical protein
MLVGGALFGYGMVLANGCGSRALVLLGRGNLRSFVVVIVLGITAQMTLKGVIAPARIAVLQMSQTAPKAISLPALLSTLGLSETFARMLAASAISGALIIFAFAHAPFQRAWGQIAAGLAVGLLVAAGWFATGYIGADDFNPAAVTSLTFIAPIADTVQYSMLSTGLTLNFGIAMVAGVFAGSLVTALATRRFHWEGFNSPRHMLRSIGGAALMGAGGCHGLWLLDRAGLDRAVDAGACVVRRGRRNFAGDRCRPARTAPRSAIVAGAGCAGLGAGWSGPLT